MTKKHITIALVLNVITCAFYIAFLAIAFILIVCHAVLVKEIRKKAKNA